MFFRFIHALFLTLILSVSLAFAGKWDTKSFSVTVEETKGPRDTKEEIRQIAWIEARMKLAEEIRSYLADEHNIAEYIPVDNEQLEYSFNFFLHWETQTEWQETDPPILSMILSGNIYDKLLPKGLLSYKKIQKYNDVQKRENGMEAFVDLSARMKSLQQELAAAEFDEVKSVRDRREEVSREFLAFEWADKVQKYVYYDERRDDEKKIECISKAVDLQPDWAWLYSRRAGIYRDKLSQPEHDMAIADFSKAIELKPDNLNYYLERAHTYKRMRIFDKALKDYNYVIEQNPQHGRAYSHRAGAYKQKGNYKKALKDYARAIELRPDNPFNYTQRAYAHIGKRKYKKAISDFKKAIEIAPEDKFGYAGLANVFLFTEEYEKSIEYLNKAIEIDPEYDWFYLKRGNTFMIMGEEEKAKKDFKKAAEMGNEQAKDILKRF